MGVVWPYGGGHSVSYEVKDSKLIITDSQSGKIYKTDAEIEKMLSSTISASSYRLDNCDINSEILKTLVE